MTGPWMEIALIAVLGFRFGVWVGRIIERCTARRCVLPDGHAGPCQPRGTILDAS